MSELGSDSRFTGRATVGGGTNPETDPVVAGNAGRTTGHYSVENTAFGLDPVSVAEGNRLRFDGTQPGEKLGLHIGGLPSERSQAAAKPLNLLDVFVNPKVAAEVAAEAAAGNPSAPQRERRMPEDYPAPASRYSGRWPGGYGAGGYPIGRDDVELRGQQRNRASDAK